MAGVEVTTRNIVIIVIYRIPGSNLEFSLNRINQVIDVITAKRPNKTIVCAGDFNIILKASAARTNLLQIFDSWGLKAIMNAPSRVTNETTKCIDKIFINEHRVQVVSSHTTNIHISDRYAQLVVLKLDEGYSKTAINKTAKIRDLSQERIDLLKQHLHEVDWNCMRELLWKHVRIFTVVLPVHIIPLYQKKKLK